MGVASLDSLSLPASPVRVCRLGVLMPTALALQPSHGFKELRASDVSLLLIHGLVRNLVYGYFPHSVALICILLVAS